MLQAFDSGQSGGGRLSTLRGIYIVIGSMITAITSFVILIGLTPIQPTSQVTLAAIIANGFFVAALLVLIGVELIRILQARRDRRAASRLHLRIIGLFSLIATVPAIVVAIVASVTLDLGLDRWFELRTRTIVESSAQVAQSYINENAINLRDASINMAFAMDSQRVLFNLDRTGFRQFLTQQARGRGMLGASIIRPDGIIVQSADIEVDLPLPLPPTDALETAADGRPVIIPPGGTNLVGALINLREIPDAYLYTIRSVDGDVLDAVRLLNQNRAEYQNLEGNRGNIQLAFALLYFGLALILLLSAIWTAIAVANRLVRPIRVLINASDEVAAGNLDVRVPVRQSDGDVGYLGETFNSMLGQLKAQRDEILVAKDQIDDRRRFSESVLSGVSAGVMGVDDKGIISIANKSTATMLGKPDEVLEGMALGTFSPPVKGVFIAALKSRQSDYREQITFTDRSGRERVFNVRINLDASHNKKTDSPHRTHVVTLDDISELVEAQRSSAWADVARRIAHEIKNPLTPIQLSAERIRRRYGKTIPDDDRAVFDQCTDTIVRQVGDIGRMVDEFSSFARMPKPVKEMRDIRETIREALFLVEVSRQEIDFESAMPEEPLMVSLDSRLIGQAVGNVVKNAAEAIDSKSTKDSGYKGKITVRARRTTNGAVRVDIIDNGMGLPVKDRAKLLEPYMTTREKGTGLGLAIVRKIMEEHGGYLELNDAPKEIYGESGAMISLVFPKSPAAVKTSDEKGAQQ